MMKSTSLSERKGIGRSALRAVRPTLWSHRTQDVAITKARKSQETVGTNTSAQPKIFRVFESSLRKNPSLLPVRRALS
ncbi:hypothetical protein FKM82_004258 [Ascaphus truei]